MKARRLFRRDINGCNTMHDLYYEYTGHTVIRFNRMIVRKELHKSLFISIYQFNTLKGEKVIDKLSFEQFKKEYINKGKLIYTDPLAKVTVVIQLLKNNGLILINDNNEINFQPEFRSVEKINYSDIPEFDFEIFYESAA